MQEESLLIAINELINQEQCLTFDEFIANYFKKNRRLLLLLFHTRLNQAILYIPNDGIQQPYVSSEELEQFLDTLINLHIHDEIKLTKIPRDEKEDIIIISNLLEIDRIEDQKIVFSKGYYTNNPMVIKDASGKVAYKGNLLDESVCNELQKIIHQQIAHVEKPIIVEEKEQVSPLKPSQNDIQAKPILSTPENKSMVSQKIPESLHEDKKIHISKTKYTLLVVLTSVAILAVIGLIMFSYIHIKLHHKSTAFVTNTVTSSDTNIKPINATGTTQKNYPSKSKQFGIDISHYNGDIVSFLNNKKDSLDFVICKATQGSYYTDPRFRSNWKMLKEKHIIRGAYHFYDTESEPIAQAKRFLEVVGKLEANDIAPILDIEEESLREQQLSKEALQQDVLLFLEYIASKTERTPIIYVSTGFANTYLNDPIFARFRLYLASWTSQSFPELPRIWQEKGLFLWQKSDAYYFDRVKNDLDIFFGDLKELYAQ